MSPKLTKEIIVTYLQYKRDQRFFLSYLRANAKGNELTQSQTRTENLPLWKVLVLVKDIASDPDIQKISGEAANALQSIVKRRARCAHWYQSKLDTDDIEAQLLVETHRYPLEIFAQVLDILWEKLPPIDNLELYGIIAENPTPADLIIDLQELELETHEILSEGPKSKSIYNHVKNLTRDEAAMRLSDMLISLSDVLDATEATEAFLWEVWGAYLAGSVNFSAAVALTNVSVDLIRELEERISKDDEKSLDDSTIISTKSKALKQLHDHGTKMRLGLPADPVLRMQNLLSALKAQDLQSSSLQCQNATYQMPGISVPSGERVLDESLHLQSLWLFMKKTLRKETPPGNGLDEVYRALRWLDQQTHAPMPEDIPIFVAFAIRSDMVAKFMIVNGEHRLQAHNEISNIYHRLCDDLLEIGKLGRSKAKLFNNSLFSEEEATYYQQAGSDVSKLLLEKMSSDIASD